MMRYLVVLGLLAAGLPTAASAQEQPCHEPIGTLEEAKSTFTDLGQRRSHSAISGFIGAIIAPLRCPYLREDQDVRAIVDELIRFVALQPNGFLGLHFFRGLGVGFAQEHPDKPPLPLEALAFAIEQGAAGPTRGAALRALQQFADREDVRAYLLRWARAEQGPPAWPTLPAQIANNAYGGPHWAPAIAEAAAFRALLEAQPELIRNERARCVIENRGQARHVPRPPSHRGC